MKVTTKRKKREFHDDNKMLFARVRYRLIFLIHLRHRLLPLASVSSACLLLLVFASYCLISPPTILHNPQLRHYVSFDNGGSIDSNFDVETVFQVPERGGSLDRDLWSSSQSKFYHGCSNASDRFQLANKKTEPNRYLLIATSGGLNQQRTGITDAVVAAYILNATLIVPKLDQKSYWKDSSNFDQIFDVEQFIAFLAKEVKIIKELPTKAGKVTIPSIRVPRKCNVKCYLNRVLPVLNKRHVLQLSKFDYRLSNRLDKDLQKLRCRVNYHALRFTDSIHEMGKKLVERMRMKNNHFIALHLRFEPDMLAFSGCYYGGGEKERMELGEIRKRWKTLRKPNPDKGRRHGRCPLSPEEIGLVLRALGYGSEVHLYVASGEVYGGEETLAPLKALFPNFHSKETIATQEELAPFLPFSSRLAALDFIVCDESDVFVTNNNGNMARMLAGRRRYFGHKPTIRPNAKKLYKLFLNRNNMTWDEFSSRIQTHQIGFMGEPNEWKPGMGEFHENPSSCICEDSEAKARVIPAAQHQTHDDHQNSTQNIIIAGANSEHGFENEKKDYMENIKDSSDSTEEQANEDEQEWFDTDYAEDVVILPGKDVSHEAYLDSHLSGKTDQPEVEEFFSD